MMDKSSNSSFGGASGAPPFRRELGSSPDVVRTLPRLLQPSLVRSRLEDRLAEWAPVTVVQGAQGFGKTTLVASWLRSLGDDVLPLWINVTPDVASREELLGYVSRRVSWLSGDDWMRQESSAGSPVSLDECLLRLPADRSVALVLDGSHFLTDPSLQAELVALPGHHDNVHLLMCTRNLRMGAALLGSGLAVNTLTPEELLFTTDEIVQLADLLRSRVTNDGVGAVERAVGGWAAPVRLALDSADGLAASDSYLRHGVLPGLAEQPSFRALMRLSLAEHLHFDLASDLDAFGILRQFEQSGLVQRRVTAGRTEFTFPTLIRDILRDNYTDADPAAALAFHRRLALHFADKGLDGAPSTFRHAVAARDLTFAQQVWAEHSAAIATTDPQAILDPLQTLTSAELAPYPSLRVAAASLAALGHARPEDGQSPAMRAYFEACDQAMTEDTERWSTPDLIFIGTGHLIGLRSRGQLRQSVDFADGLAARAITTDVVEDVFRRHWSSFYHHRALAHTMLGEHQKAMENYLRCWEHDVGAGAPHFARFSASNLALTYAVRGDRSQALRWLQALNDLPLVPAGWIDEFTGPGATLARGILALDNGDLTTLQEVFTQLDTKTGHTELWPFVAYLHAQYGLHHGDPAKALTRLDAAIEAHDQEATGPVMAQTLLLRPRLDLLIAAGEGQRAHDLLPAGSGGHPIFGIPAARIHLMTGEPVRARGITTRLLDAHPAPRERLELLLIHAAAALRMNDPPAAVRCLGRAQELALNNGMQRAFAVLDNSQRITLPQKGTVPFPISGRSIYPETLNLVDLTPREWTLLDALDDNLSRHDIAEQLFLSLNTVKTQLTALYIKLGAKNHEEALLRRDQLGLYRAPSTD